MFAIANANEQILFSIMANFSRAPYIVASEKSE